MVDNHMTTKQYAALSRSDFALNLTIICSDPNVKENTNKEEKGVRDEPMGPTSFSVSVAWLTLSSSSVWRLW